MPRMVSQASIGPDTAPTPNCRKATFSARLSPRTSVESFSTTAPPSTSL